VRKPRLLVCGAKVPFTSGGAEALVHSLVGELARRGFEVDAVTVPFTWGSRQEVLNGALAWRLLNLTRVEGQRVDRVIATRFPTYAVAHPDKVVWLVHQYRQAYELIGTTYSDVGTQPEDPDFLAMIHALDKRCLSEASGVFSISRNTARRLERFNGLGCEPLYPPPPLGEAYRCGPYGDSIFTVGRLDTMKRFDLLIRALRHTRTPVRCAIAGAGPEAQSLAELARSLGVGERVELLGRIEDAELLERYAGALGVFYAPYDEDYGYVTVEAFKSGKPVLTMADSGGVLEHVEDGVNGFVAPEGGLRQLAAHLDRLYDDRQLAARLGEAGCQSVAEIGWDGVVARLTGWEEA
jgi:glycosyltransferase involved in cell wall biosynthesis